MKKFIIIEAIIVILLTIVIYFLPENIYPERDAKLLLLVSAIIGHILFLLEKIIK